MKNLNTMTFLLAFSTIFTAHAGNLQQHALHSGARISSVNDGNGGVIDDSILNSLKALAFSAAYMYASKDPRYAAILKTLDIRSGEDLQNFLWKDKFNFQDIISFLAMAYADEHPEFALWFRQNGVTDEASLTQFMNGRGKKYKATMHSMALVQARGNGNYQEWLAQLGIKDLSDIQAILNGEGGNIFKNLWPLISMYVQSNHPEFAPYLHMLKNFLGLGSDVEVDPIYEEGEEDPSVTAPPEVVGAFRGLPLNEVKAIQKTRVRKH